MTKQQIVAIIISCAVPFLIALLKNFVPLIKQYKKWIPAICAVIGALADVIATQDLGLGVFLGAQAGLAAVGLREFKDQLSGAAEVKPEDKP